MSTTTAIPAIQANPAISWSRLIRFQDAQGKIHHGEPIVEENEDDVGILARKGTLKAKIIEGDVFENAKVTDEVVEVKTLLGPLAVEQVPIVRCVGLNYMKHILEAGRKPPPYPSIFIKPATSVADYGEAIPIPKIAQDEQCDYEGELTIVIGKSGKNIPVSEAGNYIAGYVTSNDISARKWQREPQYAGGVPQFCFSKGFDKYCPLGPAIVSQKTVGDAEKLQLQTRVNGELRQDTNTDDLIFKIATIISFISQGTTLQKGSLVMTGTPSGVGMGMNPPQYLKDGDVVEVSIEKLGTLTNTIKFE
ncbi:hypothetical protein BZA77DRAFT_244037 [Pyronema omphalodes]|nr:hypothetical protein BZA77DRAFT_244037 [Pyronema omphalodes]